MAEGRAEVLREGAAEWAQILPGEKLLEGDQLRTGDRSRIILALPGGSRITLPEHTETRLDRRDELPLFRLLRGVLNLFHRGEPQSLRFEGRGATAAVLGTELLFALERDGTAQVIVYDGEARLENASQEVVLRSGETGVAFPGQAPVRTAVLMSRDFTAIQWALYYPAILDLKELGWSNAPEPELRSSVEHYLRGDIPGALAAYPRERTPVTAQEQVYLSSLLLAVGNVAEATTSLELVAHEPRVSRLAAAHRRLIAAVVRRGSAGSQVADDALATELLADSYALQAEAKLEPALAAATRATQLDPSFGFAWTRRAELEFARGHQQAARPMIHQALQIAPFHAEALSLFAFLEAATHRFGSAEQAFEHALKIDPFLGNAWLGRGLCRIRRGELDAGREDLLMAATVEPQRSLLRSYLGKGFAESIPFRTAPRSDLAWHELELAAKLDPFDPTPWLYQALFAQQEGRLNTAVTDLDRSIALNDNRALYRSRQSLDQDLAVRGANLALVYSDLGLTEFARHTANRSIEVDYANFESHLFLANAYGLLRDRSQVSLRYEAPWLGEFLTANLLAPIGAGTVSPAVSPNEYSRFFQRRRLGFANRTEYTSQGDWIVTASQFGILDTTEYALDGTYLSLTGQRPNADQEEVNLFARLRQRVSEKDLALVQVMASRADRGDLRPTYNWRPLSPDLRVTENQEPMLVGGWTHDWTEESRTLFLAGFLQDDLHLADPDNQILVVGQDLTGQPTDHGRGRAPLDYNSRLQGGTFELQQILRMPDHTLVTGGRTQLGTFDTRARVATSEWIQLFTEAGQPSTGGRIAATEQAVSPEFSRQSAYLYDYWPVTARLTVTAGVTYDHLQSPRNFRAPPLQEGLEHQDQISPKIGLSLTPWTGANWHGAYTESLGGVSFDSSFRLEPSQVSGVLQSQRELLPEALVGSPPGQSMRMAGLFLEQRLPGRTYLLASVEWSRAEAEQHLGTFETLLEQPRPPVVASVLQKLDFEETVFTGSAHQLLGDWFALGVQYRLSASFLRQETPEFRVGGRSKLATEEESLVQEITARAVMNHPHGFLAELQGRWTRQSNRGDASPLPGDDFVQFDVKVGWRFLERRVELSLAVLNLFGTDYHLHPLSTFMPASRERTLVLAGKFNF